MFELFYKRVILLKFFPLKPQIRTSGSLAYHNIPHDIHLARGILSGIRPKIPTHVPKLIAELIITCWNTEPVKRLSSKEIFNIIDAWNNENDESVEIVAQTKEADEALKNIVISNTSTKKFYHYTLGSNLCKQGIKYSKYCR
ncbi:15575_t:CDS:2 [Cetraspora pellucida]|uniref:15575_t:CDS:1 n=1 Tax=Cetraspora pellucida TaxID=1433469 RepID=A0A9N8Z0G6_9GLOM|nr:15575_t:CDS:2 [Cetraspora pellucida]